MTIQNKIGWHVGKEIPLALVSTLLLQTFTAIWWASSINEVLRQQQHAIDQQRVDTGGLIIGAKDRSVSIARTEEQLKSLSTILNTMENRQTRIEDKINDIFEKVKAK